MTPAPLVLHGGSGIHPDDVRKSTSMNVVKINIGADIVRAWMKGLQEGALLDSGHEPPHHAAMKYAGAKVTELLERSCRSWVLPAKRSQCSESSKKPLPI